MNLDKFLESDPLAPKEENKNKAPDMFEAIEAQEETQFRIDTNKAITEKPADAKQYSDLSKKYQVPVEFVKNNIAEYKVQAKKDNFIDFKKNNPIAAARVTEHGKLGLIQDDLKSLNGIASISRRFNVLEDAPTKAGALSAGNAQLKQSVAILHALQNGNDEVFDTIAGYETEIQTYNNKLQSHYKEYFIEGQREDKEASEAWDALKAQGSKDWQGNYLSEIGEMAGLTGEFLSEKWDTVAHTDVSAEIRQNLQSAPSSFAPLPFMMAGGFAGAKTGGSVGGAIGMAIPAPGTTALFAAGGATVGGVVGAGAVGFTSNTVINYAASIKEQLAASKIDMSNPAAIKAAMSDVEFIKEVKAGALRKGVTTAAIETMLDLVGAKMLGKAFKSGNALSKAGKAVSALGVEAAGEGLGEVGGTFAQKGEVTFEDVLQGLKEAKGAIYLGGGGAAMSLAATNIVATAQAVNHTKAKAHAAKDLNDTLNEINTEVQDSDTFKADPGLMADILNSETNGQAVYFQAEDFKNHWENAGESAHEKADDLLPGGRGDLEKAITEGTPIRVPIGDLITKFGSEETFKTLTELAKRDPEAINHRQGQSFTGQLNNIIKELSKDAKKEIAKRKVEQDERQAVENDIEGQFSNAGESSADSKYLAKISSSAFNSIGQRALNEDAVTFYKRRTLEIKSFENMDEVGEVLYQKDAPAKTDSLGFYSKLSQEFSKMDFKAAPAKDIINRLNKLEGIKRDEIEWTGLDLYLEAKAAEGVKVTREEIASFLDSNGPQLEEVTLGGEATPMPDAFMEEKEDGTIDVFSDEDTLYGIYNTVDEAEIAVEKLQEAGRIDEDSNPDATKYESYSLPGGTNYREVLIRMPDIDTEKAQYTSSHFDQSNILTHMRLKDFTTADGKKTLLVDEIQSDWHQAGRKQGYKGQQESTELPEGYEVKAFMPDKNSPAFSKEGVEGFRVFDEEGNMMAIDRHKEAAIERALVRANRRLNRDTVPNAPFKQTEAWTMLAFKRILNMAAEQGYDSVSWTPGDVQADRYDISKQVSKVAYFNGKLSAWDLNNSEMMNETVEESNLSEHIGKDLADKLINVEANSSGVKTLEGVDIKVGGEGMKAFYDKMLPKAVGKYVKKLDKSAKVGVTQIESAEKSYASEYQGEDYTADRLRAVLQMPRFTTATVRYTQQAKTVIGLMDGGAPFKTAMAMSGSQGLAEILGGKMVNVEDTVHTQDVWSLPITDKLRASVVGGQPLFQQDGKETRGFTDISNPSRILLGLLKERNKSTSIHELGHVFLEFMKVASVEQGHLDPTQFTEDQKQFTEDITTILETLEIKSLDELQTEHHEKWARLFEAYIMEGKAPSERLRRAFNNFKTWLINIYRNLKGIEASGELELNLDPEMRKVFDRMLATEDEINAATETKGYSREAVDTIFDSLNLNDEDKAKLYNAHEDAKMDAEEELRQRELKKLKSKKRKEYTKVKKEIQVKYEEAALNVPLYRATDTIEKGFAEDPRLAKISGAIIEDGGLDPNFIKSELGEAVLTRFKKDHSDLLFSEKEIDPKKVKTYAQEIGRGRIHTESLTPEQRKMLRENGVHNVYSKKGVPLDVIAMELEEQGLLFTPEDQNAEDYLFELLLAKESISQEQDVDRDIPTDPLDIMADFDINSEAELLDILSKKYQDGTYLKLNTDQVKNILGKDKFKTFPRRFFSSEGIDADLVAEQLGYPNGVALIEAISSNPSKSKFIELNVTKEMDNLFPHLAEDMSRLSVEALDEIDKPDSRRKALRLELDILLENSPVETKKLLEKLIKKLPTDKDTRAAAKQRVGSTAYRNATPAQFRLIQDKARNKVAADLRSGNLESAVKEKSRELFGYEMVKESTEVRQDVDKRINHLKEKVARKSDKKLAAVGNLDMMKVVQTIMARYEMLTDTQVDKLEVYLDQLKQYDPDSYSKVEGLVRTLLPLDTGDFRDQTVNDVQEILDVAEAVFHLAKEEKEITVDGKKVAVAKVVTDLRHRLSKQTPQSVKHINSFKDSAKLKLLSADANMTRMEHLMLALDNGDAQGAFTKYMWNLASDSQSNYTEMLGSEHDHINENLKTNFKDVFKDSEVINLTEYFPGVDPGNNQIKKHELIMALVHSGNDSNKKKLLLGRNWGTVDMDGNLITTQYDKFIADMIKKGKITKETMDGVQDIWNQFERLKPLIQKAHKAVYGYYFKEIEAAPVVTPWGTYPGGYAPAITDPLLVQKELARMNEASTELSNNTYAFSSTPKGFTKERVAAYNRALSLDFRMIRGHVEKAVRFATLEESTQDLNKLLKNTDLTDDMFEVSNFLESETFRPWVARLATQQTTKLPDTEIGRGVAKVLGTIRTNSNATLMFLNLKNSLENIVESVALYSKVDRKHLHAALKNYVGNSKETVKFISENSKDMRLRLEETIYEINDTYRELTDASTGAVRKYNDLQKFMKKNTYILQQAVQHQVEAVGWMGAYNQAVAKGVDHKTAAREATSVIRTIMGSNRPIDMASIEVGDIFQRMLLTFYSFFLNKANLVRHAPKDVKLKTLSYGFLAPAILSAIFRKTYEDRWDDDDDGYVDDFFDITIGAPIRFAAATVPFGGPGLRLLEGMYTEMPYDDKLSISPAISMIESMKGFKGLMTKDELRSKDIRDSLNFFSTITGLTISPIGRPVGFLLDIEQGKQSADDPLDYTRGLITGRSKRK